MENLAWIVIRFILGGVCAFLAIWLWSKTRDASWILIIVGVVIYYVRILYQTLIDFAILQPEIVFFSWGVPVPRLLELIVLGLIGSALVSRHTGH